MDFKEYIESLTIEEIADRVIIHFNEGGMTSIYEAFNKAFSVTSEDLQTIDHDIIDDTAEFLVNIGCIHKIGQTGTAWYQLNPKGLEIKWAGGYFDFITNKHLTMPDLDKVHKVLGLITNSGRSDIEPKHLIDEFTPQLSEGEATELLKFIMREYKLINATSKMGFSVMVNSIAMPELKYAYDTKKYLKMYKDSHSGYSKEQVEALDIVVRYIFGNSPSAGNANYDSFSKETGMNIDLAKFAFNEAVRLSDSIGFLRGERFGYGGWGIVSKDGYKYSVFADDGGFEYHLSQISSAGRASVAQHVHIGSTVIGSMHNSALQQGSHNSSINLHFDSSKKESLNSVISALKNIQDTLDLSVDLHQELISEIQTLESQSKSPKPKNTIIAESLKAAKGILESAAGNSALPAIISQISHLLG